MADQNCVNTIRVLAAEMVQKAKSGHPGAPMGCAPITHTLWTKVMKYSPTCPDWINRDRFVLSNGHACALQYVMLHLSGYDLSMDDLKQFRQLNSKTPGHPENFLTPGIEVSTGPLGQGLSNAVGLAIAQAHLAATYNKPDFPVIDNFTYVLCGDGCLQEGVTSEASSLAGHLGLGKLIVLYDDNQITIDGSTNLSFTEDVLKRYEAYGWHTQHVQDGDNDLAGLLAAIEAAKAVNDQPSMIKVTTTIGFGSAKQGTAKVHGAPLGDEDIAMLKTSFGMDPAQSFHVPADVSEEYAPFRGSAHSDQWEAMMGEYASKYPREAAELRRRAAGELPAGWKDVLPVNTPDEPDKFPPKATRQHSQTVLNALAGVVPELMGGSADLTPSNLTNLTSSFDFQHSSDAGGDEPAAKKPKLSGSRSSGNYAGRYIRFGVREHAMGAICNGMAAYGGYIPFCATFLNFVGYQLGAVRVSALSEFQVLFVMTHDSIGLGEDGPTHQPIEMMESLRAMPNMLVMRPADMNETSGCYAAALEHKQCPSTLCLSRQAMPNLKLSTPDKVGFGAYACQEAEAPSLVMVASGSEVGLCMAAAELLDGIRVRVVSMPCQELYDQQSYEYKTGLFPDGVPVLSVECACARGWERYSHAQVGMRSFGKSAPLKDVMEYFGFTKEQVAEKASKLVEFYKGKPVPSLYDVCQL
eukprot:TRINITY_DN6661_c0_g1_i7.p1 TRINITY_DN6661_c0_g1~~TRINITY_DN6661_c0_g1_i7.p1  ORF type:complete len:694 (+),score=199.15 TRINITY_DN6661_c0_g1_i7:252-2333(+)